MKSTVIGPLSITLDDSGNVELRIFNQTDTNTLSAQEALDLLQWLFEQQDELQALTSESTQKLGSERTCPHSINNLRMYTAPGTIQRLQEGRAYHL